MKFVIVAIICSAVLAICGLVNSERDASAVFYPQEEALKDAMTSKCSLKTKGRPTENAEEAINVTVSIWPLKFRGIEDHDQSFSITAELCISYKHPCVNWQNSSEFAKVASFELPASEIFYPKLRHLNAVEGVSFLDNNDGVNCLFYRDGTVACFVAQSFVSFCQLRLKKFPFDEQTCTIQFQSFYNARTTNYVLAPGRKTGITEFLPKDFLYETAPWLFVEASASIFEMVFSNFNTTLQEPTFLFTFRRRPAIYALNIFFPTGCLSVLLLFTPLIPSKEPDRPVFAVTVLLAFTVLQTSVNGMLPEQPSEIGYATLVLTLQMIIAVLCSIYSLVTTYLMSRAWFKTRTVSIPMPPWAKAANKYQTNNQVPTIHLMDFVFFFSVAGFTLFVSIVSWCLFLYG